MAYTYEKKTILELIRLYKDNECLWNTSHELYSNKVARNRALDVLLVKFRELIRDGSKMQMKKKIENLRTTYRRERNKVIRSQLSGDKTLYEPSLWYYNEMLFLDELHDPNCNESTRQVLETSNDEDTTADDIDEDGSLTPPRKIQKRTSVYLTETENNEILNDSPTAKMSKTIYLTEDDSVYQEDQDNIYTIKNEPCDSKEMKLPESNLFGRTIAAQLNELRPKQRFIAEKLISEVIFFGRLEKLRTGTSINLKSDLV